MQQPKQNNPVPPRWADRLLEWLVSSDILEEVQGDLHEVFARLVRTQGRRKARIVYLLSVLQYGRSYFYQRKTRVSRRNHSQPTPKLHSDMLLSYFRIAVRTLSRQPAFAAINVMGLSLAITCCLLIYLLLRTEFSHDRFFTQAGRTYRIGVAGEVANQTNYTAITPYPLAKALRVDFPEFTHVTQINYGGAGLVTVGGERYADPKIIFADDQFLSVFDYPWVAGDRDKALSQPNSVVLTESLARRYFKEKPALGGVLTLDNAHTLKVTGVMKDVPANTHLPVEMLVSFSLYEDGSMHRWDYTNHGYVYVVLPDQMHSAMIEAKLPAFVAKHLGAESAKEMRYLLQPLADIRFDTRFALSNPSDTISQETLWALASLGVLLVMIACINFVNLSAAQALRRQREVGVRKVLGGSRNQLIGGFLCETFLVTTLAVGVSLGITLLVIPRLNQFLVFTQLHFAWDGYLLAFLATLTALVTLLSGLYPALTLARYQPVLALKNSIGAITQRGFYFSLGRSTVVFQFAAAQFLIIGTLVISGQVSYFRGKDLGFTKEALVNFHLPRDEKKWAFLRNELLRNPHIAAVSFGKGAPTSDDIGFGASFQADGQAAFPIRVKPADEYYRDTYGLALLAGHWLSHREGKNPAYEFIINETMLRKMGYQRPEKALGKPIQVGLWESFAGTVTGVVADFHLTSLKEPIAPLVMLNLPEGFSQAGVKLVNGQIPETLAYLKNAYHQAYPEAVFSYAFLDEQIASLYQREDKMEKLFTAFAGMAIFIACLGLLGLSAYAVVRRTKEVGIRKVLGASLPQLVVLLSQEFVLLVGVAFVIAAPLGWYAMHQWLENFAYRAPMSWGTLLVAGASALGFALLTVGFQATRAALANPIHSLRRE